MATVTRGETVSLALAAVCAVVAPVVLLLPSAPGAPPPEQALATAPLAPPDQPALGAVYEHPLFAPARLADESAPLPADAPVLTGIAGRLGHGAVAFVIGADGTTRTLNPGDSTDGWRLVSLAIDAAYFQRGNQQVRVPLAVPEGEGAQ